MCCTSNVRKTRGTPAPPGCVPGRTRPVVTLVHRGGHACVARSRQYTLFRLCGRGGRARGSDLRVHVRVQSTDRTRGCRPRAGPARTRASGASHRSLHSEVSPESRLRSSLPSAPQAPPPQSSTTPSTPRPPPLRASRYRRPRHARLCAPARLQPGLKRRPPPGFWCAGLLLRVETGGAVSWPPEAARLRGAEVGLRGAGGALEVVDE